MKMGNVVVERNQVRNILCGGISLRSYAVCVNWNPGLAVMSPRFWIIRYGHGRVASGLGEKSGFWLGQLLHMEGQRYLPKNEPNPDLAPQRGCKQRPNYNQQKKVGQTCRHCRHFFGVVPQWRLQNSQCPLMCALHWRRYRTSGTELTMFPILSAVKLAIQYLRNLIHALHMNLTGPVHLAPQRTARRIHSPTKSIR